jgi:hypothetical protein
MEANNTSAPQRPPNSVPVPPKVVAAAYTFRRDGFPRVRKAVLTFSAVFVVAAALVTSTGLYLRNVAPDTSKAQQNQSSARERYNQAEIERTEIRDYQPAFAQLQARGFFGDEQRLAILEAFKAIQTRRKLLPMNYSFAPQQLVALEPAQLAAPLELHATEISLHLDLLHEMDLVNFMQDLKGAGYFAFKDCTILPFERASTLLLAPRLQADCTLYWLSVAPAAPVDPAAAPAH